MKLLQRRFSAVRELRHHVTDHGKEAAAPQPPFPASTDYVPAFTTIPTRIILGTLSLSLPTLLRPSSPDFNFAVAKMGGFSLVTRQTNDPLNSNDTNNDGFDDRRFYYNSFWYTTVSISTINPRKSALLTTAQTGVIVKWTIFLSFMTILLLWVILGKWHAKRRMRKGLPPLAYHRVRHHSPTPSSSASASAQEY